MYQFVSTVELMEALDKVAPLYYDTESTGLYEKTRLAQFYQEGWDFVRLVEWPDEEWLQSVLDVSESVMHNAHYDVTAAQQQAGNRYIPPLFHDTFLAARLAFPRLGEYTLDAVMAHVLGFDPYKQAGLIKKDMQKADWSKAKLDPEQLTYASIDVYYLPQVFHAVKHKFESLSYKLDMLALRYALDFQWNGLPVDLSRIMDERVAAIKALRDNPCPVNPNSYVQVRKWLNCTESDDLALARLAIKGDEKAKLIRLHRKMLKRQNFLGKYARARIFGKFKPSARSGRFTSDDENLQQIPRALKCVFAPQPGRVFVYADYAQLELRTIAVITKCVEMIRLFRNYEDLHDFVAAMLFRVDFSKDERQVTKTCNFNFLYGGGIAVFLGILIKTVEILLTEGQASTLRNKWRRLFKEIAGWQERGIAAHRKGEVWATPFGREYVGNLMTDQLNIQNQGFGAEIAKLGLHYLLQDNKLANLGGILCNFIHDSYIIECDDNPEVYKPIAEHLGNAMQEAWFEGCKMTDVHNVPMPVKVLVGHNWGDIEAGQYVYRFDLKGDEHMDEALRPE